MDNIDRLRNRELPTWQSIEDDDPMAMVLVVNNDHGTMISEQDVLGSAVHAVTFLLLDEDEEAQAAIDQWLNGRIRKIVKRARNKAWDDLFALELPHAFSIQHDAKVYSFAPQHVSQMLPQLRKLQVSGLDFPKAEFKDYEFSGLEILIDSNLHLSTGKAVAQVCHAAQLFMMYGDEQNVRRWIDDMYRVRFRYVDDIEAEARDIEVRDAGFTEVAPNTLTCAARYV